MTLRPLCVTVTLAILVACLAGPPTASAASADAPAAPLAGLAGLPAGREFILDGGFEEPRPGPWGENNWAKNQVDFVRDPEQPWQGKYSQRIQMRRIDAAANLELVQRLPGLSPGDALLVRCALRGTPNGRPVEVVIRRAVKPYADIARMEVPVTDKWEAFAFPVVIPTGFDTSNVAFYIDLHEETTIWVDGVSVALLPTVDPRPLPAGNLVANGSFEAGTSGWVATLRSWGGLENSSAAMDRITPADWGVVEDAQAPEGRKVLRFAVHEDGKAMVDSGFFPYRHGRPLRLTLRLNAPAAGASARVAIGCDNLAFAGWFAETTVKADAPGWRTVTLDCTPGPAASGAFVEVSTTSPGTWLLDAVRVEQAPGGDAASFGCEMPEAPPGRIFRGAEIPRLRVLAAGVAPGKVQVSVRINDAWGRCVATLPLTLVVGADGRGQAELRLPGKRFGGFRCAVEAKGRLLAEQLYAVVPDLPRPDGSGRSFFGGHFPFDQHSLDLAERGGFRWLRMMSTQLDTNWMAVQPTPDRWTLRTTAVERALARGFSVLGNLNSPPEWAALKTGSQTYTWWNSRLPRDWTDYATYVQRTVKAFPGIRTWEVGNEMDGGYLLVPPDQDKPTAYADLVKRTRTAIEGVDPQLAVVGLGVASISLGATNSPFWRQALARGVAGDLDAITFHFYDTCDPLEIRPDITARLAEMRAARSRSGASPELWMGEGGPWLARSPSSLRLLDVPPAGTTDFDAAIAVVRITATFKALGLAHSFHYAGNTSPAGSGHAIWRSECNSLTDYDGSARPALAAHAAMVWLLDEASPAGAESVAVGAGQVRLDRFLDPKRGRITVAWSATPINAESVPGLLDGVSEVRDLMGNPLTAPYQLTAAPIYVIARTGTGL